MKVKNISKIQGQMPIRDPFIMGAYHYDKYPKGNGKMGPSASLTGRNIGNDFDPALPWHMYHGQEIPGFPHHPHLGFEIATIIPEGYADHFDSLGSKGRYGDGDVQLMSAGSGVLHSEMIPLIHEDKENPFRSFQIWINLPKKSKSTPPDYKMLWKEQIPKVKATDENGKKINIKVILGKYYGIQSLEPLEHSWAANPDNHMGLALVDLEAGATFKLPAVSETMNRFVLFYDGQGIVDVEGYKIQEKNLVDLEGAEEIIIKNGDDRALLFILEGEPIGEPVAAYGPFVMNTQEELQHAFDLYRRTEFGGWPWGDKESDMVLPADTGRIASYDFGKRIDKP